MAIDYLTGASIGLQAVSGVMGGRNAKRAARKEARLIRRTAAEDIRRTLRRQAQQMGYMRVAAAASGTQAVTGYGEDAVIRDTEEEFRREIDWIREVAASRVRGVRDEGRTANRALLFDTGSSLIGSIGSWGRSEGWWGS